MEITTEQMATLARALAKAQKAMVACTKDAKNPFYNSKYATLNEVMGVLRDPLADNGLAILQDADTDMEARTVGVVTRIIHDSGASIVSPRLSAPLKAEYSKNGTELPPSVQQIGSLVTYLRRYSLSSFLTVVVEDDDGNAVTSIGKDAAVSQPGTGRISAHTGEKLDTKEAVVRHLEVAKQTTAVASAPRPAPTATVQAQTQTPKAPPVKAAGPSSTPRPVSQNVENKALSEAMASGRITEEGLEKYLKGALGVPRIKSPILHGGMTLNSLGDRIITSLLQPANWTMVVERIHADGDYVPF